MPNADTTLIDLAEDAGLSLATYTETRAHLQRGVRNPGGMSPRMEALMKRLRDGAVHIPGDTTTPPAPGAVRIGPEDV